MLLWIFIVIAWVAFVLLVCRFLGINTEQERHLEQKYEQEKKNNETTVV